MKNKILFLFFGILLLVLTSLSVSASKDFSINNSGGSLFYVSGSGGNVGIGTTGPGSKLDVYGASGAIVSATRSGTDFVSTYSDGTS
ncbi:MAG: hypothetical protein KKC19_02085, partial [Nanoarchaeota archaeon]|nr:hypothetical protein [Nanoarchaeota archaeon]